MTTPEEYLCPITLVIMTDPVIGSDGRSYERAAITQWLRSNPHSPLTREPMTLSSLKTNYALKSAIERYQKESRTGAPKGQKPVVKKPKPAEPIPKLIPAPPPQQLPVARPIASAPPQEHSGDVYYAIQVYQDDVSQQMLNRRQTPITPFTSDTERRKKLLTGILIIFVFIILIIVFSKLFSGN